MFPLIQNLVRNRHSIIPLVLLGMFVLNMLFTGWKIPHVIKLWVWGDPYRIFPYDMPGQLAKSSTVWIFFHILISIALQFLLIFEIEKRWWINRGGSIGVTQRVGDASGTLVPKEETDSWTLTVNVAYSLFAIMIICNIDHFGELPSEWALILNMLPLVGTILACSFYCNTQIVEWLWLAFILHSSAPIFEQLRLAVSIIRIVGGFFLGYGY